jgi:hypothetical protein
VTPSTSTAGCAVSAARRYASQFPPNLSLSKVPVHVGADPTAAIRSRATRRSRRPRLSWLGNSLAALLVAVHSSALLRREHDPRGAPMQLSACAASLSAAAARARQQPPPRHRTAARGDEAATMVGARPRSTSEIHHEPLAVQLAALTPHRSRDRRALDRVDDGDSVRRRASTSDSAIGRGPGAFTNFSSCCARRPGDPGCDDRGGRARRVTRVASLHHGFLLGGIFRIVVATSILISYVRFSAL